MVKYCNWQGAAVTVTREARLSDVLRVNLGK